MRRELVNSTKGVIYVAAGLLHAREAAVSAQSVRKAMPGVPVALFTDVHESQLPRGLFDRLFPLNDTRRNFAVKIRPLSETPFERTLFLDTDTVMCRNCDSVFELLDRF